MTNMLLNSLSDRIVKLQILGSAESSPSLRVRVSKLFSSIDLQPLAMPPSSILLIDKIVENLSVDKLKLDINLTKKRNFESHLIKRLDEHYRLAERPKNGQLSSKANTVIFADKSELIACLCCSTANGRTANEWWWRSYFGQVQVLPLSINIVVKSMLEAPQLVPAILNQLTEWRSATSFIKLLDNTCLEKLTSAVLHTYGLSEFDQQLHKSDSNSSIPGHFDVGTIKAETGDNVEVPLEGNRVGSTVTSECSSEVRIDMSPFSFLYKAGLSEAGLSKAQICLLGIAHLLQKSPMVLRSPVIKRQVIDWWHSEPEIEPLKDVRQEKTSLHNVNESSAFIDTKRRRAEINKVNEQQSSFPSITFSPTSYKETEQQGDDAKDALDKNMSKMADRSEVVSDWSQAFRKITNSKSLITEQIVEQEDKAINRSEEEKRDDENDQKAHKRFLEQPHDGDQPEVERRVQKSERNDYEWASEDTFSDSDVFLAEKFCDTKLGGLLYLINLLKQIDFPDCLACVPDLGQQLSHWALLDAVARALLGNNFKKHKNDDIWRMLAKLGSRKLDALIGDEFQSRKKYSMPQNWYKFFPETSASTFYWATHNKRLRVWFDAGILIERDIDNIDTLDDQVLEALRDYSPTVSASQIIQQKFGQAPVANRKQLERAGISSDLAKLLSVSLPSIRKYLQIALDLTTDSANELFKELLHFDARIFIGPSHLDLTANVNSTSFPIRCSGLDQDPGWLPEYGRVVLFHFSQQ